MSVHGEKGVAPSAPASQGTPIEESVRGAFLTQIELDYDQRCLRLRVLLREPLPQRDTNDDPTDMWLRFPHITNLPHVEAFFFGRKPKPVGEHLDQVLELKEKPDGCAIQLKRSGRVRIRMSEKLVFEDP